MMPPGAGERRAEAEDDGEQPRHRNADGARHLHVIHAGADHRAEPRALHQQVERDRRHHRDHHDRQPVGRERYAADRPADAAALRGVGTGIGSPPQTTRQRSAMMNAKPSVTSTCPSELPESLRRMKRSSSPPNSGDRQAAEHRRQPQVRNHLQDRHPDVGAQHEQGAVRQVGDAHQAEDQRKARRQQEQQPAEGEAVQRLNDPELHRARKRTLSRGPMLLEVLRGRVVARIHRVREELLRFVGPELADVRIGVDHRVHQPAFLALDACGCRRCRPRCRTRRTRPGRGRSAPWCRAAPS